MSTVKRIYTEMSRLARGGLESDANPKAQYQLLTGIVVTLDVKLSSK